MSDHQEREDATQAISDALWTRGVTVIASRGECAEVTDRIRRALGRAGFPLTRRSSDERWIYAKAGTERREDVELVASALARRQQSLGIDITNEQVLEVAGLAVGVLREADRLQPA